MTKRVKTSSKSQVGDLESDLVSSTKFFNQDSNSINKNNLPAYKRLKTSNKVKNVQ